MPSMVTVNSQGAEQYLAGVKVRITDKTPPLKAIGVELINVSRRAFKSEGTSLLGRKWDPLKPATIENRKKGKGSGTAKILQDNGILKNGIIMDVATDSVTAGVRKGIPYAKIQYFGGTINHPGSSKPQTFMGNDGKRVFTKGTKPHKIKIVARPYLGFETGTPKKLQMIMNEWTKFVTTGSK